MKLEVKDANVDQLLELAILQALGDTAKDKLLTEVLAYLITIPVSSYGQKQLSPIREIINTAASRVAHTIVVKRFAEDPEFQKAINDVVSEAIKNLMLDKEKLGEAMSSALNQALRDR